VLQNGGRNGVYFTKTELDYLIERFNIEKITPDLVGKLSLNEFKELGVQNRNDIRPLW
jgi:hypothetical protein